ncbi:hypothetical protein PsYK624_012980 [Phanerochaete sordida]|uniref:Uncharacterized protein n=1 Tax=Phanerochaete sordida TaxID=48140 RepID=A0A9P3FZJ8_9APHY|nr:hypothetical protein PsYK624_012980 [Phanerochaete sordida]
MFTVRAQKRRRTATSVLAGDYDTRPQRDVLTSLLNGVPVYKAVEKAEEEEERRARKKERKEREKDKKRVKPVAKPADKPLLAPAASTSATVPVAAPAPPPAPPKRPPPPAPRATSSSTSTSSFWQARPTINIATMNRRSVTPPPMPSSPPTTPGPSISSSTSATSSKRPHTPDDDDEDDDSQCGHSVGRGSSDPVPRPRKKRVAARKGWKGWVEGSPPPSQKLINLDIVDVIPGERKTRSGKSFDAIAFGKDSWV